jgi:hypothetical protein
MMWNIGIYCGARFWRFADWKTYGLYRKLTSGYGFSIGPVVFYRE